MQFKRLVEYWGIRWSGRKRSRGQTFTQENMHLLHLTRNWYLSIHQTHQRINAQHITQHHNAASRRHQLFQHSTSSHTPSGILELVTSGRRDISSNFFVLRICHIENWKNRLYSVTLVVQCNSEVWPPFTCVCQYWRLWFSKMIY